MNRIIYGQIAVRKPTITLNLAALNPPPDQQNIPLAKMTEAYWILDGKRQPLKNLATADIELTPRKLHQIRVAVRFEGDGSARVTAAGV